MTIEDVRNAIADACATIGPWRAWPYIRDSVAPPEMQIAAGTTNYDLVLGRGADIYNYLIQAFVQRDSERAGQQLLDQLKEPTGAGSLKTVIEANTALAALVDYAKVSAASEVRTVTFGDGPAAIRYLMVEFTVEVCY